MTFSNYVACNASFSLPNTNIFYKIIAIHPGNCVEDELNRGLIPPGVW